MYQLMLSKSNECQKITNLDNFCCFIKQTYPTQFIGFSSIDNAGDDDDDDEDGADDDRGDDDASEVDAVITANSITYRYLFKLRLFTMLTTHMNETTHQ